MPDFAHLQNQFANALAAPRSDQVDVSIFAGPEEQVRRRLALYRGNVQANAGKALSNAYPVCRQLVGEDFFGGLANAYAARVHSTSGDLNEYGDRFAEFLADFPQASHLPYLPDVARLEWLVHRAHYAADAPAFDANVLAGLTEAAFGACTAMLHPACALIDSPWPLARLFEIHQPDYAGEFSVDLDAGGGAALVFRPLLRVQVSALSTGAAVFLRASFHGQVIVDALDVARRVDPTFALDRALPEWIAQRVIVDLAAPAA
ncbi:MAG TPA: DNA-binding domain-containing protein [Casimicrobiaceae bacterium]|nr:DNA-binding domain-containing protein [Casimicrobiaceae bacterium]